MKLSKKLLSLLLCAIMVLGTVAIGGDGFVEVLDAFSVKASAAKVTSYSQGDIIEFGWYPQSEETNTSITDALTSSAGNTLGWNSYGYYSGTGDLVDGQMKPSDYMRYKDVMYGGTKYRGVVFVSYRPYHTGYTCSSDNSYQDDNGYTTGNVYWFKYEPIKWRVLNPASGMVMSETILDSQAYNNFMVYNSYVSDSRYYCFGNSAQTYYASDYANSSIRQWLNDDFYNTAFTDEQKSNIKTSALNNDGYYTLTGTTGYEGLDSASTNDKVFLLSYDEVLNSKYGFSTSDSTYDSSRQLKGSDYAKCQGLYVDSSSGSSYDGCSNWRLRSSGYSTFSTCYVGSDGVVSFGYDANSADGGVRPALILSNLESNYADSEIGSEDYIYYGTYPQTDVTDSLGAVLNNQPGTWQSYGYYSGTGDPNDGQMKPSDYMRYKDVSYNGSKYRAVTFDSYRPDCTGYTSSSSNTYQDDNGYTTGNVYWFKYEPIKWRVLDPSTGLIMCDTAIDSQAYNNYIWYGVGSLSSSSEYYGDEAHTYYASNYAKSSIRAWLNKDFYNTAFSSDQKSNIVSTTLDNSSTYSSAYDAPSTTDKIFLLSYYDSINSNYGFSSSASACDTARQLKSTDYAKCQGCWQNTSDSYRGNCWWWRRSPGNSCGACAIYNDGDSYSGSIVLATDVGVVPALRLNLSSDIIQTGTAAASGTGSNDGWADSTHIRFGSYPQTDVTASMGETLDAKATGWKSYKYYNGTGDSADGQMSSADYMMYCDVTVMNGSVPEKYRGVKFSTYRPGFTSDASTTSADCTSQYVNGYTYGKTYWFKYEPLVWRVLDSSTGLVMCESIIDSQAYNNYIVYYGTDPNGSTAYWGDANKTYYANDYYNSSIRKWLTEDFYATAFSESQQNKLLKYNCDNSCPWDSSFDSQNSSDKVFLLSYDEVGNTKYGFNSDQYEYDPARRAKGTDYAKCQGLFVYEYSESEYDRNSFWWLRSPFRNSDGACGVDYGGDSLNYYSVYYTFMGVRPALSLNLLEIMKDEAKAELAEAKKNAVSDEAKTILDNAIASVGNAADVNDIVAITSNAKSDAENADKALAGAKAAAKTELETAKNNAVSDEAKAAIDTAIENVDKATNSNAVASAKAEGTSNVENADKALADAKAAAKTELEEAKKDYVSDEAKAAVDTAIANVDKATNLDAVASAKAEGTSNAENADNAYAEKIKFDNVNIKVAGAQTVDYRSIVTITATATGVPEGYKLAIYLGNKVAEGDNKSVSYTHDELKSDLNYSVKVIDANGNVAKDSSGNEVSKDGGKITCNAGFFKKLVAFFKGLFKKLPTVEVKP